MQMVDQFWMQINTNGAHYAGSYHHEIYSAAYQLLGDSGIYRRL